MTSSSCLSAGLVACSTGETHEFLDEMHDHSTAGVIGLGFANLPIASQYAVSKSVARVQNGHVVTKSDGTKVDARFVKNGRGGKGNHRVRNNRLDVLSSKNMIKIEEDEMSELELKEAMRISEEEHFRNKKWNENMMKFEKEALKEGISKEELVVNDDDDRKLAAVPVLETKKRKKEVIEIVDNNSISSDENKDGGMKKKRNRAAERFDSYIDNSINWEARSWR